MDGGLEMNTENMTLYRKKRLPTTVGQLCAVLEAPYSLHGLEPDAVIPFIAAVDIADAQPGGLYIPYSESDAEIRANAKKGVLGVLTDHYIEGIPCIVTENKDDALCRISRWLYSAIALPCTVVTGSTGKTTLKRMVAAVLKTELEIFYRYGNYNTLHSLPETLQLIPPEAEYLIQEADESRHLSITEFSSVLSPEFALVTNISDSHIQYIGSTDALIEEFRGISAGMNADGVVVINADDPGSTGTAFHPNTIRVGIYSEDADCRATGIETSDKGTSFDLHYEGRTVRVRLRIPGEHNVYNAMMAYVVGRRKGIPEKRILAALRRFQSSGVRQNYCRWRGTLVYADCYNANAMSVSYAIQCLCRMRQRRGKRIAVLGDIAEIAGFEETIYRRIAEAVDHSSLDVLLTCGEHAGMITQFVTRDMDKKHFRTKAELNDCLRALKKSGPNAYLFKASRIMTLETCIKEVFPAHYFLLNLPNFNQLKNAGFKLSSVSQHIRRRLGSSK